MKIYTRTGDSGETGLAGGGRVSKDSLVIETVGTIDEVNAVLGIVRSFSLPDNIQNQLQETQSRLFDAGAVVASKEGYDCGVAIEAKESEWLEKRIDEFTQELPTLRHFILPGGHPAAAHTHQARSVCRRAERLLVSLQEETENPLGDILIYLNRLSDYLFVLARTLNALHSEKEMIWSGASRNSDQSAS
ncbi:MAG: ATP:cob(I)alamin adenosyltransferase [Planctomycetaceae bacterium]|nr:ATP:cob(I)alamin adenosyltransferase [Planctomycetaceae bacterium]